MRRGEQARLVAEGMVYARHWRDHRHELPELAPACYRCEGTGLVDWCGKFPHNRRGPCPRCQPMGAKRFCSELAQETFGDPVDVAVRRSFDRQEKFRRNFTRRIE